MNVTERGRDSEKEEKRARKTHKGGKEYLGEIILFPFNVDCPENFGSRASCSQCLLAYGVLHLLNKYTQNVPVIRNILIRGHSTLLSCAVL